MYSNERNRDETKCKERNGAVFERLWRDTLNSINIEKNNSKNNNIMYKNRKSKPSAIRSSTVGGRKIKSFKNDLHRRINTSKHNLYFQTQEQSHCKVRKNLLDNHNCLCVHAVQENISQLSLRRHEQNECSMSKGYFNRNNNEAFDIQHDNFNYELENRQKHRYADDISMHQKCCQLSKRSEQYSCTMHCCKFNPTEFSEEENYNDQHFARKNIGIASPSVLSNENSNWTSLPNKILTKCQSQKCVKKWPPRENATTIVDARQLIVASRSAKVSYRSAANCKCSCQCYLPQHR